MKVISIWQPFATMSVKGFKTFETRGWSAPQSVVGQRIGIASTKIIRPEQRQFINDPSFRKYYDSLKLPNPEELPLGYLVGTVLLHSVGYMSPEFMDQVSEEEKAYGFWVVGNYAWRLMDPIELQWPIPIRGQQGIFEWNGNLEGAQEKRETLNPLRA